MKEKMTDLQMLQLKQDIQSNHLQVLQPPMMIMDLVKHLNFFKMVEKMIQLQVMIIHDK